MHKSRRPLLRSKATTMTKNMSEVSQKRAIFSSRSTGSTVAGDSFCSYLGIEYGGIRDVQTAPAGVLRRHPDVTSHELASGILHINR